MASIATARIKREFKEVVTSDEVNFSHYLTLLQMFQPKAHLF